jgi:hypothetical protein
MMTRTAGNSLNGHRNLQPFALALLLGALSFAALADPVGSYPAGVRNSSGPRRLNEKQLQMVQESLRQKTGFVELEFDRQSALALGNRQNIAGGSATARALLQAAVDSANLYELESHERSPEVAFAQIHESVVQLIPKTGQRTSIYQVQLDFADFDWLDGSPKAKAAFDIGIALLHELAHGVLKLRDPLGEMDQIRLVRIEVVTCDTDAQLRMLLPQSLDQSLTRIDLAILFLLPVFILFDTGHKSNRPSRALHSLKDFR